MAQKDYYKILGVKKDASPAEVKKAYRRLARKHHPDINPGDKASEEKFKQIQEAYSVLSDPDKKRSYDRFGDQRATGQAGGFDFGGFSSRGFGGNVSAEQFSSFGDLFSEFFGGAGGGTRTSAGARPTKAQDLEYHVSIPFLEAIRGTRMRISYNRQAQCTVCGGKGSTRGSVPMRDCPTCGGRGQVQQRSGVMNISVPCSRCGGSGQIAAGDCAECGGDGLIQMAENLDVKIPAGVNNGSRVRLPHRGNAGAFGGPPGDLYLVVKVQPHEFFEREGRDVVCQIPVTLPEAVLGARIEVPTVDGTAWLNIPEGTQSGQKFRLRKRGAPDLKGEGRGDQIVVVRLVIPPVGDEKSKDLLREFAALNPHNPRSEMGLR